MRNLPLAAVAALFCSLPALGQNNRLTLNPPTPEAGHQLDVSWDFTGYPPWVTWIPLQVKFFKEIPPQTEWHWIVCYRGGGATSINPVPLWATTYEIRNGQGGLIAVGPVDD